MRVPFICFTQSSPISSFHTKKKNERSYNSLFIHSFDRYLVSILQVPGSITAHAGVRSYIWPPRYPSFPPGCSCCLGLPYATAALQAQQFGAALVFTANMRRRVSQHSWRFSVLSAPLPVLGPRLTLEPPHCGPQAPRSAIWLCPLPSSPLHSQHPHCGFLKTPHCSQPPAQHQMMVKILGFGVGLPDVRFWLCLLLDLGQVI